MESQPVNLSNKNAFAGANLGVPCSPMEAVTSLDPKDYVWTNPLTNWQVPPHPFPPPGLSPISGGLLPSPGLPPASPLFPGFGGFPWGALQNFCFPSRSSTPQLAHAPPSSDQMKVIGDNQLQHSSPPMIPVKVSPLTHRKPADKVLARTQRVEGCPQVDSSDLLQCCIEDDELKHLLEDPLDIAFEGLASDSSNASCLTSETSSPGVVHVGLDNELLSLTDFPFPCMRRMGKKNDKGGSLKPSDDGKLRRLSASTPAHWGVKKKRSTRKSKFDLKSMEGSSLLDTNINDVPLIELDEMLWGMEARSIPTASSCLIPDSKMGQDQLESGIPSSQLTNASRISQC